MKPTHWVITYTDPKTQTQYTSKPYYQRAQARGAVIIAKALGMLDVSITPQWSKQ